MKLRTGGHLTFYMPQRQPSLEIRLEGPTPLLEILDGLHIPVAEVDLVALNGELANVEDVLVSDEDTVHIYASVNGG